MSTYASVLLLSLLSGVAVTKAQSILDLQRIEALKGKRHHSEANIPEWMKPRAQSQSRTTTSHASRVVLDSARIEWTQSLNSGSIPGDAAANDVALDAAGNIYVTGKSESPGSSFDILTMKYDPSGILQWTARYDGPAHGDDIGNAIALDMSGNVYITGFSIGDGTGYDYVTIKYNSAGVEQWVARYNGPADLSDAAADLLVDNDGSVYVTGASTGLPIGQFDYATVKYNSSGTEVWVERYAGPLEWGEDRATSLALDQAGNVYVTGYSMDTVGRSQYGYPIREFEFATIKYTSQGATEWVRRHDVPDTVSFVVPPLVEVDEWGNVIVVGMHLEPSYPVNSNSDIVTIKYTPQGDESWVASYACAAHWFLSSIALMVDTGGNVYVGSVTRGAKDSLLTVKYNAGGSEQWVARFTGVSELLRVSGIALDHTGNVFVTGSETEWGSEGLLGTAMVTLKYSENGSLEWNQRYTVPGATSNRATAIAVSGMESEGEVIVVGECGSLGMATLKYDASGNQLWAVQGGKEDVCLDFMLHMDTDEQENVYIVAEAQTLDGRVDYMVAKYNPSGDQLWQSRFVNPVDVPGYISDMAIDPNGSVYLCGWVYQGDFMSRDYMTVKFGADGGQEWVARYAGPGGSSDEMAMAIDVDDNGNSYVTGFGSSGTEWRMITVKYGFAGNEVWVRQSADQGSGWDIEVDNAGFVYAAGLAPSVGFSAFDFIVTKYDPSGSEMWVARWGGFQTPEFYDLAVDDSGNAFVTGYLGSAKFNNAGTVLWGSNGWGNEILLDGLGGLYFLLRGNWLLKYTTGGVFQWSYNYLLFPLFAEIDGDGNVLLIEDGYSIPRHARLVSLDPLGQENWATDIVFSEDLDLFRASVRADESGNSYVAYETGTAGTSRITLVKYNQVAVSVGEPSGLSPHSFGLFQNYPNPFNPTTSIKYQIPHDDHVSLSVYDVLGREVATLVNGEQEAGSYTAMFDGSGLASGMYFYRLKAGEYSETRKLLLLK